MKNIKRCNKNNINNYIDKLNLKLNYLSITYIYNIINYILKNINDKEILLKL
jgi:hypothetical protein